MVSVRETITITRPVEDVFKFAADYRNDTRWRTGVQKMSVIPNTDAALGSVTHEIMRFAGKTYITEANVVGLKVNQHVASKSVSASIPLENERRFEAAAGETHFTYSLNVYPETMLDKLMMPVLRLMFRNQMQKDLKKLKSILEQN